MAPRPLYITSANIVLTNQSPELHLPMYIFRTAEEWSRVVIPELPAGWPWSIYNDGAMPDSQLYLYGYPTINCDLELFTWQEILPEFSAITDAVVLPPGYEAHIVNAFVEEIESLYPLQAKVAPVTRKLIEQSRRAIVALNAVSPQRTSDADDINSGGPSSVDNLAQRIAFYSGNQA